ncbi:integrase [Bradyrhizobium sp. USDA 3311]
MAKIELPYVAWRDGRPRFVPGSRERAMGYKGKDLKHDDGRWFSLDEAHGFAMARRDEIRELRKTGKKLKAPPAPVGRAVKDLWNAYIKSDKHRSLAGSSQKTYGKWVKPLQAEPVWQAPVGSIDPVVLKALHEKIKAERGLSMANGVLAIIAAMMAWGRLHNWLPRDRNGQPIANPASNLDLESPEPRLRVGTDVEIRALVGASDLVEIDGVKMSAIGDAVLTGLFTGQRKKDILEFAPGAQTAARMELVQSKTGARVSIPMAPRLVQRVAAGKARRAQAGYRVVLSNVVVNESTGLAYNGGTFADHFAQVRAVAIAGIVDEEATCIARELHAAEQRNTEPPTVYKLAPCKSLDGFTFPDLRDTAVTWYARAGSTVPQIASITGHSLASIYRILKHYLALDAELADEAVRKLVDWMEREGLAV